MLIVDAANVIGSRPDGWWRDRVGAADRFVARVKDATTTGVLSGPVTVVLEGRARAGHPAGTDPASGVAVVHAPASGDDAIAGLAAVHGADAVVVTADRGLGARVTAVGGGIVGPRWLLDRLDRLDR